ncbi:alkaline shock response membrane anchor protein AmaP [Adlercreutzia sp. ZJ138]|uniref:alkaline shock response membrane anchor protein AmaP n=1 Tax=Adlercreutzia sp. ZJ138 TaxID=2709405 RepID=UPI0013EE0DD4|nr:alkaline shock response membrane anchor protein AmaP [Adlercreutzia sp. ZJ138]
MRKITRIGLVAFALATVTTLGLFATLWFAWGPLFPFSVWLMGMDWFNVALLVMLGIIAAGAIAMIIAAIAAPGKDGSIAIERKGGTVSITKDAIRSSTKHTVERFRGLTCKRTRVSIRGGHDPRISIHANVNAGNNANLAVLGARLQHEIAANVSFFTGCPVKHVDITFTGGAEMATTTAATTTAAANTPATRTVISAPAQA